MTDTQLTRAVEGHLQGLEDHQTLYVETPRKQGKTWAIAAYRAEKAAALRRQYVAKGRRRMQGEG